MTTQAAVERIQGYCALCTSRCGSIAVVQNGRFVALEPDPTHPTGQALCAKRRAAPELVYHADRLLYPLKRTRPKGDPDPGWQRTSWDVLGQPRPGRERGAAALGIAARRLLRLERRRTAEQLHADRAGHLAALRAHGQLGCAGWQRDLSIVPAGNVGGEDLLSAEQRAKALGLSERPLGPSRTQWVTSDEVYRAILEKQPYAVRGLVGFGANLLLAHADVLRGRAALVADPISGSVPHRAYLCQIHRAD